MKAYEFPVQVTTEGTLEIPMLVAELLPRGQIVRVIVLVSKPTDAFEQHDWTYPTAKEFFAGYADADSIYDKVE